MHYLAQMQTILLPISSQYLTWKVFNTPPQQASKRLSEFLRNGFNRGARKWVLEYFQNETYVKVLFKFLKVNFI